MIAAADDLVDVSYEGILPPAIGTPFCGDPKAQAAIRNAFQVPSPGSATGTENIEDFFNGLTASRYPYDRPCST